MCHSTRRPSTLVIAIRMKLEPESFKGQGPSWFDHEERPNAASVATKSTKSIAATNAIKKIHLQKGRLD